MTGAALKATSILAELESGRRRAAVPDAAAPGGWRADHEVKAAILACFRDRTTVTWDLDGAQGFSMRHRMISALEYWKTSF